LKKGWKSGRDVLVRMADGRVTEMGDLSDVLGRVIVGEDALKDFGVGDSEAIDSS
jgi:hypothetical protein